MTYEMIKRNYDAGLWNEQMVEIAIKKGVITEDEYYEIVGDTSTRK